MKTRLLYSIEFDTLIPVAVITKHSDGICTVQEIKENGTFATLQLHVSASELAIPDLPAHRSNFVDPLDVLKAGTQYWGTCVAPSPFPKDQGCARWLGQGAKAILDVRAGSKSNPKPSRR